MAIPFHAGLFNIGGEGQFIIGATGAVIVGILLADLPLILLLPLVLIAGGQDKGGSYAPLAEPLRQKARALVLMGEAADRMQAELKPPKASLARTTSFWNVSGLV